MEADDPAEQGHLSDWILWVDGARMKTGNSKPHSSVNVGLREHASSGCP